MIRSERILQTVREMFAARDYRDIMDEGDCIVGLKKNGTQVCAFSTIIPKLNSAEIHNYISILYEMKIDHCILIHEGIPTPAVKNIVANTINMGLCIELFSVSDLLFNITKHRLVPRHVCLEEKEAKEIRKKYNNKLPVLLKTDPVAKFYNFQHGDVIKIIRCTQDETTLTLRLVK